MYRLLGVRYLADSLNAFMNAHRKNEAYMVYVTDCLYAICGGLGGNMNRRFYSILHPEQLDGRSGEEIAMERLERFGIKVVA